MRKIVLWIFGIVAGLAILGLIGFGGSNRQNYYTVRGNARGAGSTSWQNVTWNWTRLTDKAKGTTTTIPDPKKYTIVFKVDNTVEGKADCNKFSGTYSTENGSFVIKLGPSTLAACGENSLDQQYLTLLSSIVAGGPASTNVFALETAGGLQRMEFEP